MSVQFIWDEKYSIGDEFVDAQHKYLFELANSVQEEVDEASAKKIIMQLYRYTRKHFADEERVMTEVNYPKINEHKEQHVYLVTELNDKANQPLDKEDAIQKLKAFIYYWLVDHILNHDMECFKYVQKIRQSKR